MIKRLAPVALLALSAFGQAPKDVAPGVYVTPGDMKHEMDTAPNPAATLKDRPVRIVRSGDHNIGVANVKRTSGDTTALIHDKIDEIYYILEGSGTLTTGGTVVAAEQTGKSDTIGPGWRGKSIQGGTSRHVEPGEVIFVPAGTPHMFTAMDGNEVHYLIYRIDPTRVLPNK